MKKRDRLADQTDQVSQVNRNIQVAGRDTGQVAGQNARRGTGQVAGQSARRDTGSDSKQSSAGKATEQTDMQNTQSEKGVAGKTNQPRTIISFRNVSKTFVEKKQEIVAVQNVTFDIKEGEFFGIIGYSGAGKSTLLRLINQLETTSSGELKVGRFDIGQLKEKELRYVRKEIGMVFQHFNLFSAKTIAKNIGFPLSLAGWKDDEKQKRINELLSFIHMQDRGNHFPNQLSGGQKQRVGIARAIATRPQILLADEVTSALDPETTVEVLNLLKKINRELGITIVMITHTMNVARYSCDRIAVMEGGKIVELKTTADLFSSPEHETTKKFVKTANENNLSDDVLAGIKNKHPELKDEINLLYDEVKAKRDGGADG